MGRGATPAKTQAGKSSKDPHPKVRGPPERLAEAPDIVESRDEGGGGGWADAGDGAQALDARVLGSQLLDGLVGVRGLGAEVVHDRQQLGDRGPQPARQRQGGDPLPKGLCTAGGHAVALLAEQGAAGRNPFLPSL